MTDDPSNGWEAVADAFAALRAPVDAAVIARWAGGLPEGACVVDIGCGTGVPVATTLRARGCIVYGIDPAPTLLAAFRRHCPGAPAMCEPVQASRFFDRKFDAAVAIGLMFLLDEQQQRALIGRLGHVLRPAGQLLFTAPPEACAWHDSLTGRLSRSLGTEAYAALLGGAGLQLVGTAVDAGGNVHHHAVAASS